MAPAEKRSHPRESSQVDEDEAILAAVVELQPYAAPTQQIRSRWQQVAERVIVETGQDEISGAHCKRSCESLLERARNVSEDEWNEASADDRIKDFLKKALAKHRQWERSTNSLGEMDRDEEATASQEARPTSQASRYATRGSKQVVTAPVVSPANKAQRKTNARRELLSRVTAVREREKKRVKATKTQSTPAATSSLVLSSLVAELTSEESNKAPSSSATEEIADEEPASAPPPCEASSPPVEAAAMPPLDEHDSMAQCVDTMDETPVRGGEACEAEGAVTAASAKPPAVSDTPPPARRSFIANVFDNWFKRKAAAPVQDTTQPEQDTSARSGREQPLAPASDITASDDQVVEVTRTVPSLTATLATTEVMKELKLHVLPLATRTNTLLDALGQQIEGFAQLTADEQSLERRVAANEAALNDCHAKLNEILETQQKQPQRMETVEQQITTLVASLSAFQKATTNRIHQNHFQTVKFHAQLQLEVIEMSKILADHIAEETLTVLQQLEAATTTTTTTSTTTEGNEV